MWYFLVPAMLATAVGVVLLWPGHVAKPNQPQQVRGYGTVQQVVEQACTGPGAVQSGPTRCGTVQVGIDDGPGKGTLVQLPMPSGPGAPVVHAGDHVVLSYPAGASTPDAIIDQQRGSSLVLLVGLGALAIIAVARLRGLTALVSLALSFGVLVAFILPAILSGRSPLGVAVVGSAAIMFAMLYLTNGVSVETSVAVLGTLGSLALTGVLGAVVIPILHLTGIGSDENAYLSVTFGTLDMRGLLLAGVIIGSLGVLNDVTVTQAAAVTELARTARSRAELYRSTTRIGRAHAASSVNTIALAYAGASLPLLLLISIGDRSVGDVLSGEFFGQEIVRTVVGTIGLVAAVPITNALGVLMADLGERRPRPGRRHEAY
jgi:uncharacterized membrane protein